MRLVIQRVIEARVTVGNDTVGSIQKGLLVLLGISHADTTADADRLLEKLLSLRIFPDDAGKMNRSVAESCGALVILRPPLLLRSGDAPPRGGAHLAPGRRLLHVPSRCWCAFPFQFGSNLADLVFNLIPLYLIAGQRHL